MAGPLNDELGAPHPELGRASTGPLDDVRRAGGELRTAEIEAWLSAGDNLAEKAVAALDTGDDERAERLARRIIALPVIEESTRSGLMAVNLLLYNEVVDPSFEGGDVRGLLDQPLRMLPTLDERAADALRHVLAAITEYELPAGVLRRIREVVALERRLDPPFAGVPEEELPAAVLAVLRLILRLRADEETPGP